MRKALWGFISICYCWACPTSGLDSKGLIFLHWLLCVCLAQDNCVSFIQILHWDGRDRCHRIVEWLNNINDSLHEDFVFSPVYIAYIVRSFWGGSEWQDLEAGVRLNHDCSTPEPSPKRVYPESRLLQNLWQRVVTLWELLEELNEMGDADPSLSGADVLMVAVIVTNYSPPYTFSCTKTGGKTIWVSGRQGTFSSFWRRVRRLLTGHRVGGDSERTPASMELTDRDECAWRQIGPNRWSRGKWGGRVEVCRNTGVECWWPGHRVFVGGRDGNIMDLEMLTAGRSPEKSEYSHIRPTSDGN